MDGWFYEVDGERRGPFTLEQMKELVAVGGVRRQTRVWRPGAEVGALTRAGDFLTELSSPPKDEALAYVLPIGRSGWAIAAGYVGLLSLIPIVSYAGVIVSLIAARDLKAHPEKRGWGRVITGLVISIPMTVLYTWLFLASR
ncbi:MAG TPA: DUF4339 domain-containing protein [Polyangia bacterium]|jgi:hypothetical protein